MPTVFGYHDVKDKDHWLASRKREEFFGPLGITSIRTFVDRRTPLGSACSSTLEPSPRRSCSSSRNGCADALS